MRLASPDKSKCDLLNKKSRFLKIKNQKKMKKSESLESLKNFPIIPISVRQI